ncbi:MAG: DUF2059 domain-containing protein [Gammaproteobacteria bacterium]
MKINILLGILLSMLPLTGFANGTGTLPEPLRTDILQLMKMTGAARTGPLIGNVISQQLVNNLKAAHPDIAPKAFTIVQEETQKSMSDPETMNQLVEMLAPIYAKYYTDADVRQMIAFYKTPLGQKIIRTNPEIAQASLQDGEQWGRTVLAPELIKRIQARFQQEGIKLTEPRESPQTH